MATDFVPSADGVVDQRATLVLLIDHDNVPFASVRLISLIECWLDSLRQGGELPRRGVQSIQVRAYGGWYSGTATTPDRYSAAEFYQRTCPSVMSFEGSYVRLTFQFADELLDAGGARSSIRLTHTVAERSNPTRATRTAFQCPEDDCEVASITRWIRTARGCTRVDCPHRFSDVLRRLEQKQVDVHMAIDLLTLATSRYAAGIALASDDADMLPALAAAGGRRNGCAVAVIRFDAPTSYLDGTLRDLGCDIIRCEASA